MFLSVEYKGYSPDLDDLIRRCAEIGKAGCDGSGFLFGTGTRDLTIGVKNERQAEHVAGILKSNLPRGVKVTYYSLVD